MGRHSKPEPAPEGKPDPGTAFDKLFAESIARVEQQVESGTYPYEHGAVTPAGEAKQ